MTGKFEDDLGKVNDFGFFFKLSFSNAFLKYFETIMISSNFITT